MLADKMEKTGDGFVKVDAKIAIDTNRIFVEVNPLCPYCNAKGMKFYFPSRENIIDLTFI